MKTKPGYFLSLLLLTIGISTYAQPKLEGAWQGILDTRTHQKVKIQAIIENHYLAVAYFSADDGSFIRTLGGPMNYKGDDMSIEVEFDSQHPEKVGTTIHFYYHAKSNKIKFTNSNEVWKRVDYGNESNLTGAWQLSENNPTPNVKTVKILSGTRYQWIAYDVSKRQFQGTSGGSYSTEGATYTETTLFSSRNHSHVDHSTAYEYEVIKGEWHQNSTDSQGKSAAKVWSLRK